MGLYDEFRFRPASWLPHSELPLEELERVRNIRREDMEYTNENGYSVRVVLDPTLCMVQDMFYRIVKSDLEDKPFSMICPNQWPGAYSSVANMLNKFHVSARNVHAFAMDEWADEDGELGPVYGVQWRSWPTPDGQHIDQIQAALDTLRNNPDSRRNIVSAWNVSEIKNMALPPCHLLFQLYVADGKLSCQLYQRSADMFLGVPFNIASYALLTHMFAQQAGLEVGEFIWTGGDCHIYDNHKEQVAEQLTREARPYPTLELNKAASMFDYSFEDISVTGYDPHPLIRGKVAV